MALLSTLCEILKRPSLWEVVSELSKVMAPLWLAMIVGMVVGWSWKPKWAESLDSCRLKSSSSSLVVDELVSMLKGVSLRIPSLDSFNFQLPSFSFSVSRDGTYSDCSSASALCDSLSVAEKDTSSLVTESDLDYLCKLKEEKDGGPAWIRMMDRSTPNMAYQAWRRDPETGPPHYRTRTVYEDTTPELLRDFFWDDEFRSKWDEMLASAHTLQECPTTGTMVVQWVRKFPFFCSDREYIIGRRIWESDRVYYCVTKGVPCSSVPRRQKPRRVDLYYSSWCIRAVESKRGDGQLTASEVVLFHHEDMGIPREVAKLGVRHGMWGSVKKIESGLRAYQKQRALGTSLSRCAYMAHFTTKVTLDYLKFSESNLNASLGVAPQELPEKPTGKTIPRLLMVGAIVLACTFDRGLLTRAVIFGVPSGVVKVGRMVGRHRFLKV